MGNYERFIDKTLSKINSFTTGQVYQSVIRKRKTRWLFRKNYSSYSTCCWWNKDRIFQAAADNEFLIIEIGGTVGDIESLPF